MQAEKSPSCSGVYDTTDVIINDGLVKLFGKILSSSSEPSGIAIQNMRRVCACMCNATNRSFDACKQVVGLELPAQILKYLKHEKLDPKIHPTCMDDEDVKLTVINLMCTLHNVMKVSNYIAVDKVIENFEKVN